jgi:hypothetical protein
LNLYPTFNIRVLKPHFRKRTTTPPIAYERAIMQIMAMFGQSMKEEQTGERDFAPAKYDKGVRTK